MKLRRKSVPRLAVILYSGACILSFIFFMIEPSLNGYRSISPVYPVLLSTPWNQFFGTSELQGFETGIFVIVSMVLNAFLVWMGSFLIIKGISHAGQQTLWID